MVTHSAKKTLSFKKRVLFYCLTFLGIIIIGITGMKLVMTNLKNRPQNHISANSGNLVEYHFNGLYAYDAYLGWVPQENVVKEKWGFDVKTLNDGIRSNGTSLNFTKDTPLVMAFGDSFTFGDDVADHETWPAHLERLTGYQVLNAGVSSYGLDQLIMRAEKLVPLYKPDIIVVSMINDDVIRASQKVRHGVQKPYYTIVHDELVLQNVPIPFKQTFRAVFRHSNIVHRFMNRFFADYWWAGTMDDHENIDTDHAKLTELLFNKLNELAKKSNTRTIIMFQITKNSSSYDISTINNNIEYVRSNLSHVEICDATVDFIVLNEDQETQTLNHFFDDARSGHLASEGNELIAQRLKKVILHRN